MGAQTRARIVEEARRLFAEHGYAGTSVAAIERASGLKPGAGGLYAHFDSKQAVLVAAVSSMVDVADRAYTVHATLPLEDVRSELTVLVRGSLRLFDAAEDWIRLRAKVSDQFPHLFEGKADLSARAHRYLAGWLEEKVRIGVFEDHDCRATADVLFGAIASYWQRKHLGPPRAQIVSEDKFIAAWIHLAYKLVRDCVPAFA